MALDRIRLEAPERCVLWREPALIDRPLKETFEHVRQLHDSSHWWRDLLRCWECGQLYLQEFYEEIDWDGGHDAQYVTFVPVADEAEVRTVDGMAMGFAFLATPSLRKDWPSGPDAVKTIGWER